MYKQKLTSAIAIAVFVVALFFSERALHSLYDSMQGTVTANVLDPMEEPLNSGPVDVLFFGDSTGRDSIVPAVIEEETGLRSLNVASYAMISNYADIYFLENYLQKNPPPKKIFVLRTLYELKKPLRFDQYLEVSPDIGTSFYLLQKNIFTSENFVQASLARHGRFLRENNAIRRKITSPWNYNKYIPELANGRVIQGKHFVRDQSLVLLQRMCDLVEESNIQMYMLQAPYREEVQHDSDFLEATAEIIALVKNVTENSTHCSFIDTIHFYKEDLMADKTHTTKGGAEIFSRWLANTYLQV